MNKVLQSFSIFLVALVFATASHAQTENPEQPPEELVVTIDYVREFSVAQTHTPGSVFLAAVGGRVLHDGSQHIGVSLKIGGQTYTTPLDPSGEYSFLVWANASRIQVSAWNTQNKEILKTTASKITLK